MMRRRHSESLDWFSKGERERREAAAKAAAAAEQPPPSASQIRAKMRKQEGIAGGRRRRRDRHGRRASVAGTTSSTAPMHHPDRAAAADVIGLTSPGEFEKLKAASAAARLRPRLAASGLLGVGVRSAASSSSATSSAEARHQRQRRSNRDAACPKFPSQAGFIPSDRDFGNVHRRRSHSHSRSGGAGSGAGARLQPRRSPHEVELEGQVSRTLAEVKSSYFPRSKISAQRSSSPLLSYSGDGGLVSQTRRNFAGGSFVVYKGQGSKLQARNRNYRRQMSMLKQNCVLTEEEVCSVLSLLPLTVLLPACLPALLCRCTTDGLWHLLCRRAAARRSSCTCGSSLSPRPRMPTPASRLAVSSRS
eukprot:COSAG01_NODE_1423_length_10356_cov_30.529590_1_plen_362_part_00